ncbi:MAG: T9SS type A sorting domain-containing protein [Janthinobacterium lividum]
MPLSVTLRRWLLSGFSVLATAAHAQTTAPPPTLLDDFNRADNPIVGTGWLETESTTGTGAAIVSNQLRLSSGVIGKDFVSRDMSARYSPVLRQNANQLSWLFNMQQSRPNPSGFASNNYGVAFVLAASAADFTAGTTNGYAVVYGNSGTPDSLKLVRFTGGLNGPANLKTLASVSLPVPSAAPGPASTVRVLYAPDEDNWTLEVGSSSTAFTAPLTTTYTRIGIRKDSAFVKTALPYLGCFWNHAATASEYAVFDNIYATAPCVLGAEPTQGPSTPTATAITSGGATLSWSAGNGAGQLVVVRPTSAAATVPADGLIYNGNASYGAGSALGAGYVVSAGTSTSVNLTNLNPNTAYAYQVYELLGTGCTTNYLQASPASGTFTTPACVLAAAPATASYGATATSAGRTSATFTWFAGSGAGRLVLLRPTASAPAAPASGTSYVANAGYGAGSALGNANYVVYAGTGTSVTVSNLTPGQNYTATVFEYNGTGCATAYQTTLTTTVAYTVPVPAAGTLLPFRGNIHAHSSYSDGNQDAAATPLQDFQFAAASLHSDFLGISEHNHSQAGMSLPNYAVGLSQATQATTSTFVALYGMEWGVISGGGHVVVYGVNQLLGWEPGNYDVFVAKNDYQSLFKEINRRPGAFATLAHPQRGDYGNLATAAFSSRADSAIVGTVLRSGPATSTNLTYSNPSTGSYTSTFAVLLARGYHTGITLDHDNHNTTFLRTTPGRLVVLAPALTRADLLDALRQRHFYASDDWNAEASFTINSQPMGSIFAGSSAATIQLSASDPDNEVAGTTITLMRGVPGSGTRATALTTTAPGVTTLSVSDALALNATAYYYGIIRQADGDSIVTSPIWYTRQAVLGTKAVADPLALTVYPNPTAGTATLSYYLPTAAGISADVSDMLGRRVATVTTNEHQAVGPHTLAVPALPAGLYLVRLLHNGVAEYRKLLVE